MQTGLVRGAIMAVGLAPMRRVLIVRAVGLMTVIIMVIVATTLIATACGMPVG